MSLLDRYITRSAQGNVLWLGPESLKQLTAEVEGVELKAKLYDRGGETPCPNVVVSGGTSYCALAESSVQKLREERDALKYWKDSALEVESRWDCQKIGKLLGLSLGEGIRPNIEPKIRELIAERDALRKHADAVMEALHNYDMADGNANWQEGTALRNAARAYRTAFPKEPKP